ncbi:MAG: hypothetical protein JXB07_16115 [Anaerolineae bacterium]|nr:hypothetical protein [Anaerolineae bacterium]
MPTVRYPFHDPGPEHLEISWKTSGQDDWSNIVVRLDGQEIGTVPGKRELEIGQTFFLPDGSVLGVQLVGDPYKPGLRVVLDGRPLPGSAGEMAEPTRLTGAVRGAAWTLCFFGALNVVGGLFSVFARSDFLEHVVRHYGISPVLMIFGLAQLGLAFPIWRRSMWALVTVAVLMVIEGVFGGYLVAQFQSPYYYNTTVGNAGIVLHVMARVMMLNVVPLSVIVQGVLALRKLKRWQPSTI